MLPLGPKILFLDLLSHTVTRPRSRKAAAAIRIYPIQVVILPIYLQNMKRVMTTTMILASVVEMLMPNRLNMVMTPICVNDAVV